MALTAFNALQRRGSPAGSSYGYQVAPGETIWGGGFVALNTKGYLQRVQTAGSVVVVGIADRDYSNVGNANPSSDWIVAWRGYYVIPVAGATPGDINEPVFATDDNTVSLTPAASGVAGAANTGNGTVGTVTATAATALGDYQVTFTSATAFSVTDPRGFALAAGVAGTAYSQQGLGFTITSGGTAFLAGDTFNMLVGGLQLGTLNGFDKGVTGVRIQGT